jgi:ribosomal protein S27E
VPDPAPIPCTKCGAVLAHADGGKVRVSERAVAVGRVTLVCTGCGAFTITGTQGRRRLAAILPKNLDTAAPVRQTGA